MAATLFANLIPGASGIVLAESGGGLVFALEHSTLPGRLVLIALFAGSVLAWTVMVTKFRVIRRARLMRRILPIAKDRRPEVYVKMWRQTW